jgi:hypothetical protein
MVDRFKKSFEKLQPPVCLRCKIDMTWYRSEIRPLSTDLVDHHFHCVSCGTTQIVLTNMKGETPGESGFLSKPFVASRVRRRWPVFATSRLVRGHQIRRQAAARTSASKRS